MTLFSKQVDAARLRAQADLELPAAQAAAPVDAASQSVDPLASMAEDPAFAEQRERREAEQGLENLDQGPMTVGKTDSDEKVAEGEFGMEPKITKTKDGDIHADHDDSTSKHTAELEAASDIPGDDLVDDDDLDDDDFDPEIDDDKEIGDLENELVMLSESVMAIENYGVNATSMRIMQTTHLLSGTALESLGLESFGDHKPQDAESQMAIEALSDKIKEKATEWATKILHIVKTSAEKISSALGAVWTKISGLVSSLSSASWDAAKSTGAVIKAHPYKSAAAIVTAIAAVAAVISFAATGSPIPGTKSEAFTAFLAKMRAQIAKISLPDGAAVKATLNSAGTKIAVTVEKVGKQAQGAALKSLGWTQQSVKAFGNQLSRAWDLIKSSWGQLSARAVKMASGAAGHVSEGAKGAVGAARSMGERVASAAVTGYGQIASMVVTLANLTRKVVADGFYAILATLRALASAVGAKASSAASAAADAVKAGAAKVTGSAAA